ncbi:DMT family transporter [Glaciecola sp.]|jgi:drug/metabolite transporter (DMT)-like permease|uniref:DMT family transporter n=1 Tax=Glaciecola sp. MF2-115 TaxID=3384827 RepID=UPI003989C3DA
MKNKVLLGAIALLVAEAFFAGVGAIVKQLSDSLTESQLVFFRNLFALFFLGPFCLKQGREAIYTKRIYLHLFRAATGLAGMYCFFFVLGAMSLTSAIMALKMAPFFIPIIAKLWLKEQIPFKTSIAIAIGFIGVAFILNPQEGIELSHLMISLLCALLVATTTCTIRKMSDTEPAVRIVFYFISVSTLVTFPLAIADWRPIIATDWLLLVILSALAVCGQLLMTQAFRFASPVKIGLLGYSSVLFAALIGYIFWDEPLTLSMLFGGILLLWAANVTIRQRWFI